MEKKCSFCNQVKNQEFIYEGMSGNLCQACLMILNTHSELNDEVTNFKETTKDTVGIKGKKITIKHLKKEVDKVVMGQERAKRQLIVEFYKHKQGINTKASNIFIIGNSGVGKTHLVRSLANLLDVPFLETDATIYTEAGYKGKDVTSIIDDLIIKENGNRERVEQSIIFLDEIDKTTTTMNSDAHTSKVQEALLKLIEGTEYNYSINTNEGKLTGYIDTSKIMFVLAGACVGLSDIREERLRPNHSTIGFSRKNNELVESSEEKDYNSHDLIEFGFIPEFVGRCSLVVELHPLTQENMYDLLINSPDSVLNEATTMFEGEGIELIINDNDVQWLANKALNHPLGVRSLTQLITKELNEKLFESTNNGLNKVELNLNNKDKYIE